MKAKKSAIKTSAMKVMATFSAKSAEQTNSALRMVVGTVKAAQRRLRN